MYHHLSDYEIRPSVVPADQTSAVTVRPLGRHSAFVEGLAYTVRIWPMETACADFGSLPASVDPPYSGLPVAEYTCVAAGGVLTIEHFFNGEQTHAVTIALPADDPRARIPYTYPTLRSPKLYLYSCRPDLYGRRVYKGDLHLHTCDSDGHDDIGGAVGNMRKAGYDFLAITNHNIMEPSEEAIRLFGALPPVMTLLTGEEVHVPHDRLHAVSVGAAKSVNKFYRENKARCDEEAARLAETLELPDGVGKLDFAYRVWIARKSKEFGGMPIFVHPHWIWFNMFFVADSVTRGILKSGEYEAFELLNGGCGAHTNNMQTAFYQELRAAGVDYPIVGSSDSHCTERNDPAHPTDAYTLVFAPDSGWDSLHASILSHYSVAVEKYGSDQFPRVYGSYRLVKYAMFLIHNYFPVYIDMCHEQGRLMKRYALTGEAALAEPLAALKAQADRFTAGFFGADR